MMNRREFFLNAVGRSWKVAKHAVHESHLIAIMLGGGFVLVVALAGWGVHVHETALIVWPVITGLLIFVFWMTVEAYYQIYRDEWQRNAQDMERIDARLKEISEAVKTPSGQSRLEELGNRMMKLFARERVCAFMWEGFSLALRCANESVDFDSGLVSDWQHRVEQHLLEHLGQPYFQRFRNHAGVEQLPCYIRSEPRRYLWEAVRCGAMRLNEFYHELQVVDFSPPAITSDSASG